MKYTATKFDSVEQKEKFDRQFRKFVSKGFRECDFPKWFYQELSNCFGHIAHYNQAGFYQEFFLHPEDQKRFLCQCASCPCYGDPAFTYSDVEHELREWIKESGLIDKLSLEINRNTETMEREVLRQLKKKYETK